MGFTSNTVASPFKKNTAQQRKRSPNSKIVVVDSYDLPSAKIHATALDGTKMIIHVSAAAIGWNKHNPQAEWEGFLIDKRMSNKLPAGTRIVIEKADRLAIVDGVWIMECTRIINLTDQSPDKAFEGVYSVTEWDNKVFNVQHWNEQAIAYTDSENIEGFKALLDSEYKTYTSGTLIPTHGFQFRVIDTVDLVMDLSPRFDWIPSVKNEGGEEIKPGTPISGSIFEDLLNQYKEHVEKHYPKHFVEIMIYTNYRHGPKSRYAQIPEHAAAPLRQLVSAKTRLAIGDTDFVTGGNIAVKGVIQLTADQVDMRTKTFNNRNIVARLFPDGPIGHVCRWIKTAEDHKVEVHSDLKVIRD